MHFARIDEVRSERACQRDAMSLEIKACGRTPNVLDSQVDEVIAKLRASHFGIFGFLMSRAGSKHQRNSDPLAPHAITIKGFDRRL